MDQINFSKEEINEFQIEVLEMLQAAEDSFLKLEKGELLKTEYPAIFRAFHSIKGGAGMFNLQKLQHHMHEIENIFQQFKNQQILDPELTAFFISSIDASRKLIDGQEVQFDYSIPNTATNLKSSKVPDKDIVSPSASHISSKTTPIKKTTIGKVFIIDDQPEIVEIITDHLSENFTTFGFTNPQEAILKLQSEKPDLVITDVIMPEMTGIEVLKKCIEYDPELPVIFLSGELTKQKLLEALSLGVYNAIEKPFEFEDLFGVVENAVSLYTMKQLLNKAINLIMYQFPDLSQMLIAKGQHEVQQVIAKNTKDLLEVKRRLKSHRLHLIEKKNSQK